MPSTSIAAHAAAEEVVEDDEMDEKLEVAKNAFSTRVEKRAPFEISRLPFQLPPPPPLPVSLKAYLQVSSSFTSNTNIGSVISMLLHWHLKVLIMNYLLFCFDCFA